MSFNVAEVEQKVKAIEAKGKTEAEVEACRNVYLEEIMDWSDYCMESEISLETEEGQRVVQSLIDLWYSFVKFEASFNYFKKAADLFDKALDDNVVGMTAEIYRLYADYFVSRGKPGLATKGFQRGLTNAKLSTTESYKLWLYFADFVKESKNFHVESMQILYQMLYDQLPAVDRDRLSAAPPDAEVENIRKTLIVRTKESLVTGSNVVSTSSTTSMRSVQQDVAESKEGEGFFMQSPVKATPITSGATAPPVAPPVVKPSNPLLSSVDIDELETNISGGLSAEQLIRLFRRRPPMLFVAPNKEPMSSGMNGLIADEVLSLEKYLDTNLCYNNGANASGDKLEYILDILEALWYSQALKERHFDSWCVELSNLHVREGAQLEKRLQAQNRPDMAVKLERDKFMTKCAVQRELLQAVINKVLYTLLLEQQRILVTLQFPRFSKTFLPRIENMSLFTTAPNASSLFEDLTTREIVSQRKFVCALLSLRLVGGRKIRRFAPLAPIRTDATSNNSNDGEHSSSNSSSKEVAEAVPDVLAFLNSIEVPVEDAANATTVNTPGSGRKKRRRAESSTSPDDKNLEMVYLARRESYGQEDNMRVVNSAVDDEDGSSALVPQLVSSSYDQVMPAGFQEDQDSNSGSEMEGYDDEGEEEQARFSDVDENMQT